MNESESKVGPLDKIEVAERQIDMAIWLWFNEGDIVSITTLTDAAFGICDNLWQHRKWGRPVPVNDDVMPDGMTPKLGRVLVRGAGAFSKHARTDPDESYEYKEPFTELYIHCAVMLTHG